MGRRKLEAGLGILGVVGRGSGDVQKGVLELGQLVLGLVVSAWNGEGGLELRGLEFERSKQRVS